MGVMQASRLSIRTPVLGLPSLGDTAAEWMAESLVYGPGDLQGQPFKLDGFQREFIEDLYRFDPKTGRRVVRRALLGVAKGNAKSELEAAIDLFELHGPCVLIQSDGRWFPIRRAAPDIPVAAASYEHADLVFGAARIMCEPIAGELDVFDKEIQRKEGTGRM